MRVWKMVVSLGLSTLLVACSTAKFGEYVSWPKTNTEKGMNYLLGHGVYQSDEKAFYYFKKAADRGDAQAQNELGYMYAAGKGTPQNYEASFAMYQRAAKHGVASAQYNLGLLYLKGLGVTHNTAMAQHWFRRAAQQGFAPAKKLLHEK